MSTKAIRKRCTKAFDARKQHDTLVDEVFDYCIPYRQNGETQAAGESRLEFIYDATAPKGAMRFAGRMQQTVTPLFETFFKLEVGPGAEAVLGGDEGQLDEFRTILEGVSDLVSSVLRTERFHAESHGFYLDLFAGMAFMLVLPGETDLEPVEFLSVPYFEVAVRADGRNRIVEYFWRKKWEAAEVIQRWENGSGTFSEKLRERAAKDDGAMVTIVQSTRWDAATKQWQHTVYCEEDKQEIGPIDETSMRQCPWISPRFYVVPGEPYGRGVGMVAMPNIKSINMARELFLRNAEFGMLGMWTYKAQEVNPATIEWKPGGMIPVTSNGGQYRDASMKPLEMPGNVDLAQFVIEDERMQIQQLLLDTSLPSETGAVRSPTEIIERMKLLAQDLGGAYGRLVLELIIPLVRRVIEILADRGLLPMAPDIDQFFTSLKVTSPIAAGESAALAGTIVEWLTMILQLGGEEAMVRAAVVEDVWALLGRFLGVPEKIIRDQQSAAQLEAIIMKEAQKLAQQMVEQAMNDNAPSGQPAAA